MSLLIGCNNTPRCALVAVGATHAGPIMPSTLGAQVGDLIMIRCPSFDSGFSPLVISGSGWNDTDSNWASGVVGFSSRFTWKALTTLADITLSGSFSGVDYAIYRGPTTAAIVVTHDETATTTNTPTWPSKNVACVALVAWGMQGQASCNLNAPTGWSDRQHVYQDGFALDILDNFIPPAGGHSDGFTGCAVDDGSAYGRSRIIGVELRT